MSRDIHELTNFQNGISPAALKTNASGIETVTGAGAVDPEKLVTKLVTTGADALTLADGANGELKIITMLTDGGNGTLTPTNLTNGSTITFGDVGDSVLLIFTGSSWAIVSNNGCTVD